jgi:hypothetical protein
MLRRVGRFARSAQTWRRDQGDVRAARNPSEDAYSEINALFVRIIRKTRVRPDYLWGSLHGAHLAKSLGIATVSLIEFGVAGGNGLVDLDQIALSIEALLGVRAGVYGFDTGRGLPVPVDARDCPNLFSGGDFPMDVRRLRARLRRAELILGDVADTVGPFLARRPPPTAFISFDLDLYSSTVQALRLLETNAEGLLPRVHSYFDDITGYTYAEFNGERLAIREFNERNRLRKISPIHALNHYVPSRCARDLWVENMHLAHILDHPLYGRPDGLVRTVRRDLS